MQFAIEFDSSTEPSSVATHCFVSLPSSVASSLNQLTPFAPLTVLHIHAPHGIHSDLYLAWATRISRTPATISIHPRFARSLPISAGTLVIAKIVERLTDPTNPTYPLLTATLRPISYNFPPPTQSHQNSRTRSCSAATAEFRLLSAAAPTLQETILPQIRVLYPGLVFPLVLPASKAIDVQVVSVQSTKGNEEPPYALVQPNSEIVIEPPPPEHRRAGKTFCRFLRVLALPSVRLLSFPECIIRTHAIIPPSLLNDQEALAGHALILVSKKLCKDDQSTPTPAIPLNVLCDDTIPQGCVVLPIAAWNILRLTPLVPVLVEQIYMPPPADSPATFTLTPYSQKFAALSQLPDYNQIREAKAVMFNGLLLKEGVVVTDETPSAPPGYCADPWDDPGWPSVQRNELSSSNAPNGSFLRNDTLEPSKSNSGKSDLEISMASRNVQKPYYPTSTATLTVRNSGEFPKYSPLSASQLVSNPDDIQRQFLTQLTPSCAEAVNEVLHLVHEFLDPLNEHGELDKPQRPVLLIIEGAKSTGKTHVCQAVAAILRSQYHFRTAWVRGSVHQGEDPSTTGQRIERACYSATDCGPGLVVLDDVDVLCGTRNAHGDSPSTSQNDPSHAPGNPQHAIDSARFTDVTSKMWGSFRREHSFLCATLVVCETAKDLPSQLRVPGVSIGTITLPSITAKDRAFLIHTFSQLGRDVSHTTPNQNRDSKVENEPADLLEKICSLAELTERYSARDLECCFGRAKLNASKCLQQGPEGKSGLKYEYELIDALTRIIREGKLVSTVTSKLPTEDSSTALLNWGQLGGVNAVRKVIEDTLRLRVSNPDVYQNQPLRLAQGLLLYGPSGCGKTTIAKIAASEYGLACVVVKGPELMSKYIGESEAQVRHAFGRAASCRPCVLLFDEFDALAPRRGTGLGGATGVSDRVVNTLLTCLDGVERLAEGVFIIATTSRPETIDPALLRPGRLDKWVGIDLPHSVDERVSILRCHASQTFPLSAPVNDVIYEIARGCAGYSGADLGAIVNDAEVALMQHNLSSMEEADFIVDALKAAWHASRPSISERQRVHYSEIMERFGHSSHSSTSTQRVTPSLRAEDVGKKLTLH